MPTDPKEYKKRVEKAITGLIDYLDIDPEKVHKNALYRRTDLLTYLEGRLRAEERGAQLVRNIALNPERDITSHQTVDDKVKGEEQVKEDQPAETEPHVYASVQATVNEGYIARIRGIRELVPYGNYQVFLEKERLIVVLNKRAQATDLENFKTALKRGLKYLKIEILERKFTYDSKGNEIYINIRNETGKDKAFEYLAAFKEVIDSSSTYRKQQ